MPVEHWMQFSTFAEQNYFVYPNQDTYNGVIINANMAVHAGNGIAAFIQQKIPPDAKYIIDPLTHAFQHDPSFISNDEGKPKSSIQNLADIYGEPISETVGNRPTNPNDFSNDKVLNSFTKNVIDFQRNHLSQYMKGSDVAKYIEENEVGKEPYAIIAPNFYLTETTINDWLPISIKSAKFARELLSGQGDPKLFLEVTVSQGVVVNSDQTSFIADELLKANPDGFILWVDNLDEKTASGAELKGLLNLSTRLRNDGQNEVINLHGGYFSVLGAGNAGGGRFSGVSHGPEFGEYRSVVPVGGGIPIARYYVPELHSRERYRDALQLFNSQNWLNNSTAFHSNVCNCNKCQEVIERNADNFVRFGEGVVKDIRRKSGIVRINFPSTEAKIRCLQHYLQCKNREYTAASDATKEALLQNLLDGENKYTDIAGLDGISHLRLWRSIFENLS